MRAFVTGASSSIGGAVLEKLIDSTDWEFHCVRHRGEIRAGNPRVSVHDLDLASSFSASDLPDALDLVIHFAGVTHAREAERYWNINCDATKHLADVAFQKGCRRFVYISTRCATVGSGDYGASKLAAEEALKDLDWQGLMIIRPSEIYGGESSEGIDKFIGLARDRHIVPMLFGDERISFSPLFIDDLVSQTASRIAEMKDGVSTIEMCGPEELSGVEVASRLARAFKAVPVPVWWPAMQMGLGAARLLSIYPVEPDQVKRLVCDKTCKLSNSPGLSRFYPPE